jgi:UDP-N-acetylglucosamine acyltransferase
MEVCLRSLCGKYESGGSNNFSNDCAVGFMTKIHPTAIISEGAKIAASAKIGAYCVIGAEVEIGENVELKSHIVVDGKTSIGDGTVVFPFASLGTAPQDLKYVGEKSTLVIGKNNKIREHVTMNTGTADGAMTTIVGDNCLFMMASHVAHDCVVGNNVILANNATLAGHVQVGDGAIIGGLAAIHQFVRIGKNAMIGGMSGIENDVIPYGLAMGERATLAGLNLIGLKRKGLEKSEIQKLRAAFKELFAEGDDFSFAQRIEKTKSDFAENTNVLEIIKFLEEGSSRAVCKPKK